MSVILITGATSGIGRHAALWLARRGHHVLATGRNQAALTQLAGEAGDEALSLDALRLDVTDADSIAACRQQVLRLTDGHGVDVLVNNAGYGQGGAVLDLSDARVRAQYDTNVFGLLAVTRAFAPDMVARGTGRIINVSSIGGLLAMPLFGVYTSSKFAVEALSDALRVELAPSGVQVVLVEPGAINTNFNATLQDRADSAGAWAQASKVGLEAIPAVERIAGRPEHISRVLTRIVEGRRVRARYIAPFRFAVVAHVARLLPSWVRDTFFSLAFRLRRAPALTLEGAR